MATNFPANLDSYTDIDCSTSDQPKDRFNNIQDSVEALQTKVGIDSSAVTSSLDYLIKNTSSSNPGHKHTLADGATDVTSTATELNYLDGSVLGDVIASKALVADSNGEIALKNNKALQSEDSGGTDQDLVKLNSSDVVELGNLTLGTVQIRDKNACRIYLNATQSNLTDLSTTKILLDTDSFDYNNLSVLASNVIQVSEAGLYLINGSIRFDNVVGNKRYQADVVVNTGRVAFSIASIGSDTGVINVPVNSLSYLNANDTIELRATSYAGVNTVDIGAGEDDTWLSVARISNPA